MPDKLSLFGWYADFAMRVLFCDGELLRTRRTGLAFVQWIVLALGANAFAADEDWSVASRSPEVVVYERPRKGFALREFKAIGVFAAPPEVIKLVIDDVAEYPHFMPYLTEARVISREAGHSVSYQRISPPLVSDLDYTVRVSYETRPTPGGTSFCNRWQAANELGPPEKPGVKRVKITEGSWLLEPQDRGRKTLATYCIFSDSGSSMPTSITNAASRTAIPKLFKSIQKQAQLPRYLRP